MPLYLDTTVAFGEAKDERNIVGGQFGLASKEFTPAMAKAVFDNLTAEVRCTPRLLPPPSTHPPDGAGGLPRPLATAS